MWPYPCLSKPFRLLLHYRTLTGTTLSTSNIVAASPALTAPSLNSGNCTLAHATRCDHLHGQIARLIPGISPVQCWHESTHSTEDGCHVLSPHTPPSWASLKVARERRGSHAPLLPTSLHALTGAALPTQTQHQTATRTTIVRITTTAASCVQKAAQCWHCLRARHH